MTVAEGLVAMWVADTWQDLCDEVRDKYARNTVPRLVDVVQQIDPEGHPLLLLRIGDNSAAVRIQIAEVRHGD